MASTTTPGSLHSKTLSLLQQDGRSLLEISVHCGVSYYWIKKFFRNENPDPSVNRVQALYEFLTQAKLEV